MPDCAPTSSDCLTEYHSNSKQIKIEYLPFLFLVASFFFIPRGTDSEALKVLATVFVSIVLEAIPFMLVGSLVGGLIEAFISRERMATILPRKEWLTVCFAAGAGLVFPVCECAVVPVVRRLTGKGLPVSAAIAYLLGGPIVNPIVAVSTALAYGFDWRIVILRLSLGYTIAVCIGIFMGQLLTRAQVLKDDDTKADKDDGASCGCHDHSHPHPHDHDHHHAEQTDHQACSEGDHDHSADCGCHCGCGHPVSDNWLGKVGAAFSHAMHDFLAVGQYLIIGAFIAALAQTYINRSNFLDLTAAPILSIGVMMLLAILLNLCSEADAFIAASFRGVMPIPAQIAFLLTGPMFDLKLLLMYQSVFKRKAIIILASLILGAVLAVSFGLIVLNGRLQ